jgi:nucleoid-associated protein YgaU
MSISTRDNNPFITGYIVNYEEGDQSLERSRLKYNPSVNDKLHTITDFDTLTDLAYDAYGNSKYWWIIADINLIHDPFILEVNTNIIIPDINHIKSSL